MTTVLGEKLAAARRQRGWSLRQVEAQTSVRNAHLSQIETGSIERPDPNVLWTLAQLYDIDFDELMQLAGHVRREDEQSARRSGVAVAWRALDDLTVEEQHEVLTFMAELRRKRQRKETDTEHA